MPDFKVCPHCGYVWPTRESLLCDPTLVVNGYQADFDELEEGLLLFTHGQAGCRTTLAITARDFMDLYQGPRYPERQTGGPNCPRLCHDQTQLGRCQQQCECAFVREVVQVVRISLDKAREGA